MNNNQKYKEQLIRKIKSLEMTLKYGEEIEKESKGKNPNWETVYNFHVLEK